MALQFLDAVFHHGVERALFVHRLQERVERPHVLMEWSARRAGALFHITLSVISTFRSLQTSECAGPAHFAPPCRSFIPLNKWHALMRTRSDPCGERTLLGYRDYIRKENSIIICVLMRLAEVQLRSGRPIAMKNSPDLTEAGRPCHWATMRDIACLWIMEPVRSLRRVSFGITAETAPMCAFDSPPSSRRVHDARGHRQAGAYYTLLRRGRPHRA